MLFLVSVLALALKSSFFDWCAEYFKDPQMRVCLTTKLLFRRLSEVELKQTVADEPGSVQYNCQVWRQQRNDHVSRDTSAQAPIAGKLFHLGKSTFLLALGGFLDYSTNIYKTVRIMGCHSFLNLQLQVIPIIIIACSYKHSI